MVVSAAHFKEVTNGYEKRSDGLWVHKGTLNAGYLRATNNLPPTTGSSTEIGYSTPGPNGYMLAYDRDTNQYRDMYIYGKNVVLSPQGGGTVQFPAGTAQALIGNYATYNGFSTSTTSSWLATTVTTGSIACTGVTCRFECNTQIYHSVAGGGFYTGLLQDGAVLAIMSYQICPGASYSVPISWVFYYAPPAGNHTFIMAVNIQTAGTLTINAAAVSCLYVTEQRR